MTELPSEAEVVVVGAGPAGCVLGYLLARSGVDVALLERESDLYREFRGYYFQPLVVRLLDQMGLLDALLTEVPHEKREKVYINAFGRTYSGLDYTVLSESPRYGLIIEQPPLLRFLLDRAELFDSFSFHPAVSVTGLITEDTVVRGVTANPRDAGEEFELSSRLVVGADGRFSTVRRAARIDPRRKSADVHFLWFKLPREAVEADVLAHIEHAGVVGYVPMGDDVQVSLLIRAGEYHDLREDGIEALHDRILTIEPSLEPVLEAHLADFSQCSLLAPDPGVSEAWIRNGVLLVGDAAHVANPFGAQGNTLAIQDAVAAHPHVVRALRDSGGPLRADLLREYEDVRRPAVSAVMKAQERQMRAISSYVTYRESIPTALCEALVRGALGTVSTFPRLTKGHTRLYAFGPNPIAVETPLFEE